MTQTSIAIVNKSTVITSAIASKMTVACNTQVNRDFCPAWGKLPVPVTYYAAESQVPKGSIIIYIFDDTDQQGALGYHDETVNGVPYGKIFAKTTMSYGCPILYSNTSPSTTITVSTVLSHEILETIVDTFVDIWVNGPSIAEGSLYAYEVCDPVESNVYQIAVGAFPGTAVSVSNFVFPRYFDTASPAGTQLDQLKVLKAPFGISPNGYITVTDGYSQITDIYGAKYPEAFKASKAAITGLSCQKKPIGKLGMVSVKNPKLLEKVQPKVLKKFVTPVIHTHPS